MIGEATTERPLGDNQKWPKVAIIILNWNGWQDTLECLRSVLDIDYRNHEIILVDNCSTDESVSELRRYANEESDGKTNSLSLNLLDTPAQTVNIESQRTVEDGIRSHSLSEMKPGVGKLTLIKNDRNAGFAAGNNIGIRFALDRMCPDYILLLNNDTVVDRGFLNELVIAGSIAPDVGFFSPKIYFYSLNGRRDVIQYAGAHETLWACWFKHIGFRELDRGQYDAVRETDYAHGSCMLVRTAVIDEIGLLDEDYFCYREENDWAIRGRRHKWRALYVPSSIIWHKGGRSGGGHSELSVYYTTRNDFVLLKKNASKSQYWTFLGLFITWRLWYNVFRYVLFHRDTRLLRSFIAGITDGLKWKKRT